MPLDDGPSGRAHVRVEQLAHGSVVLGELRSERLEQTGVELRVLLAELDHLGLGERAELGALGGGAGRRAHPAAKQAQQSEELDILAKGVAP